ncbi:hypothetical protein BD414DRAFT_498072 [Trametes punicea]|nr:hypothetical protein BD414DRAFT_498072 [Trametes punicea]
MQLTAKERGKRRASHYYSDWKQDTQAVFGPHFLLDNPRPSCLDRVSRSSSLFDIDDDRRTTVACGGFGRSRSRYEKARGSQVRVLRARRSDRNGPK